MKRIVLFLMMLSLAGQVDADKRFYRYFTKGKFDKAIKRVEKKVPDEERSADLWYHLGIANEEVGNNERALACFNKSNTMNRSFLTLLGIGRIYNKLGHHTQALALAGAAFSENKSSVDAKWEIVKANFHLRRWVGMDKELQLILKHQPDNMEAKRYLGTYFYATKKYNKALPLLVEAFEDTADAEMAFKIAVANTKVGQSKTAIQYLKYILKNHPKNDSSRVLLARIYYEAKNYGLALNEYKQIVDTSKVEGSDVFSIAISYDKSGMKNEAQKWFEKFLRSNREGENYIMAKYHLGAIYLNNGRYRRARSCLEEVNGIRPNMNGINLLLAETYDALGMGENAIVFARKQIKNDSTNVRGYITLIELYEKKNWKTKAKKVRDRMEVACPNSSQMNYELGHYYIAYKRYSEALKAFEKSFVLKEHDRALEGIAMSAFHLKKFHKARGAAESVLRNDSSMTAIEILAKISVAEQQHAEAISYLKFLVNRKESVGYYNMMAYCYEKLNMLKELYATDAKVIELDTTNTVSLERLAFHRSRNDSARSALVLFERLTKLKKPNAMIHYEMHKLYLANKDTNKAVVSLKAYIGLKPRDVSAQIKLAAIYYDTKAFEKALYWYKRLDKKGEYKGFYNNYARIVISKGIVDDIIDVCEKAVKKGEADHFVFSNMGLIYKRLKQYSRAKFAYSEALKLDAKDIKSLEALAECQLKLGEDRDAIVSYEQLTMLKKAPKKELKILAKLYEKNGNRASSVGAYKRYLKLDRRDIVAIKKVALFEYDSERFKEAKKYFEMTSLNHSPDFVFKYGITCFMLHDSKNVIRAMKKVEHSYKGSKEDVQTLLYCLAESYEKTKDTANAVKYYSKYIEVSPEAHVAYKAARLQESLSVAKARPMYEKNIRMFPQHSGSFVRLGFIYNKKKMYAKTRKMFEKAATLTDSIGSEAWLILGSIYQNTKNREKEKWAYTELLKREPNNFEANKRLGTMHYDDKEFKEAAMYLELARTQNYNDPDILFILSHIYFRNGRHQEAILMLMSAKKLRPKDCSIRHYLLSVYIDLNDWGRAKKEAEELLKYEMTQENMQIYAEILVELRRYDRAIKVLKEMKKRAPMNIDYLLYMAHIYRLWKHYDDAIEVYKTISYIDDQHPQALFERAETYVAMRKPDDAKVYYERALKVNPKNAMALLGLGKIYRFMGKKDVYFDYVRKAHKLDPRNQKIMLEMNNVQ